MGHLPRHDRRMGMVAVTDFKRFSALMFLFNGCLSGAIAILYSYEGRNVSAIIWGFTATVWVVNAAGTSVGWERPRKRRGAP
jgi:hypothetical protein